MQISQTAGTLTRAMMLRLTRSGVSIMHRLEQNLSRLPRKPNSFTDTIRRSISLKPSEDKKRADDWEQGAPQKQARSDSISYQLLVYLHQHSFPAPQLLYLVVGNFFLLWERRVFICDAVGNSTRDVY
jgi:hypothetical protein